MAIKALIGFVLVFAMGFCTGAIHGIRITTEKSNGDIRRIGTQDKR